MGTPGEVRIAPPLRTGSPRARRVERVLLGVVMFTVLAVGPSSLRADDSRVVVVAPSPNGTRVPLAADEKVGAVTFINPPGSGGVVVVRVDKMPKKPDFSIVTPDGISHPFANGDSGVEGITVTHEAQVVQDRDGKTWYRVVSCFSRGGRQVGCAKHDFPPNSRLVHDPPQPDGTAFQCPDAVPAEASIETLVLDDLGVSDDETTQVWSVPSGEFHFSTTQSDGEEVVRIAANDVPVVPPPPPPPFFFLPGCGHIGGPFVLLFLSASLLSLRAWPRRGPARRVRP